MYEHHKGCTPSVWGPLSRVPLAGTLCYINTAKHYSAMTMNTRQLHGDRTKSHKDDVDPTKPAQKNQCHLLPFIQSEKMYKTIVFRTHA